MRATTHARPRPAAPGRARRPRRGDRGWRWPRSPTDRPATARELGELLQGIQAAHGLPVTDMRLRPRPPPQGGDPGPQHDGRGPAPGGPARAAAPLPPRRRPPYPATPDPAAGPPSATPATIPPAGGAPRRRPARGARPAAPGAAARPPAHPSPGRAAAATFGPALGDAGGRRGGRAPRPSLVLAIGGGDDDDGGRPPRPAASTPPRRPRPPRPPPTRRARHRRDAGPDHAPPATETPDTEAPETTADAGLGDPIGDTGFYVGDDPDHEDVQVDACGSGCASTSAPSSSSTAPTLTYQPIGYTSSRHPGRQPRPLLLGHQDVEDSGTNGTPPGFWVAWPNTDEQLSSSTPSTRAATTSS